MIEMELFKKIKKFKKDEIINELKFNLEKNYNKFRKKQYIITLYNKRNIYDTKINKLSQKKEIISFDYLQKTIVFKTEKISENFINDVKMSGNNFMDIKNNFLKHITNVSYNIINKIENSIQKSISTDPTIESSCCISPLENYNFYNYIKTLEPDIDNYILELK